MSRPPAAPPGRPRGRAGALALLTALCAGLLAVFAALLAGPLANEHTRPGLVPWIALLAATVAFPLARDWLHGRLDLLHPLVFAALYFVPAFVLGGLMLAAGWSRPYYLAFVDAPAYQLPLTLVYLALGFAGLTLGCRAAQAARLGTTLRERLPRLDWPAERCFAPATLLLLLGLGLSWAAFQRGLIGYQAGAAPGPFDAAWYYATLCLPLGGFLTWAAFFRRPGGGLARGLALAVFGLALLARVLLGGSRAPLPDAVLAAGLAFVAARRPITRAGLLRFVAAAGAAVAFGFWYGSTFREVKGSERPVTLDRQVGYASQALRSLGTKGPLEQAAYVGRRLADRMDQLSAVAVIVANAERLRDEERRLGLADNILEAARTSLVPRLLWPGKPSISAPRAYAALYFRYAGNSFPLTPVGDLLRNFGPWGIPLGMALLGLLLGTLHGALVEGDTPAGLGRVTLYFMLLSQVSYESTYAIILPALLRVGFVSVAALGLVELWLRLAGRGRA